LQVVDPDAAKSIFGEGKTVQSTIPYENGTTVTVFTDGTKQVSDAAGNVLAGEEALAIIDAAQANEAEARGMNANAAQGGKLDAEIDKVGEVEAEKKAAANNQEIVKSANTALATISSTIRNYDDALAALDQGANTGIAAARLPVLTDAGALLENAKLRLGLDVIASVTFGALS
jgi:superfamily I DNA and RNA helicase